MALTRQQAITHLQNQLVDIVKELKTTERNSEKWYELQSKYKDVSNSLQDMFDYKYLTL